MTVSNQSNSSLDADIAAFLASPEGASDESAPAEDNTPAEENTPADDTTTEPSDVATDDIDTSDPDAEVPAEDSAPVAANVDTKALAEAISAEDPVAFVKALGEHADKLLTGRAHKALRLQVKAVEDAGKKAEAAQVKADDLASKLSAKYGDPIAARKAAQEGDVNSFLDMVEKWAGHDWNTIQRWVASGIAGRPARLEVKQKEDRQAQQQQERLQQEKQAEVQQWIASGLQKLEPELFKETPELADLVYAEMKAGFNNGINTPAKALPAAKKKLQEQYERLHKVFGKGKQGGKTSAPSPSARAKSAVGSKTREMTTEEAIAWAIRESGGR